MTEKQMTPLQELIKHIKKYPFMGPALEKANALLPKEKQMIEEAHLEGQKTGAWAVDYNAKFSAFYFKEKYSTGE